MADQPADDTDDLIKDASTDTSELSATPVTSVYKVLGELTDADGVGVLGQNDAGSGTPIGVQGTVPNATGGYGLSTPDDARIRGAVDTDETDFVVEAGTVATNDATNVIHGHASNRATSGVVGGVIGGGGYDDGTTTSTNEVTDDYGVVVGGQSNTASGPRAIVGGGLNNTADHDHATVAGGRDNTASAGATTVAGGKGNTASGFRSTIAGGLSNETSGTKAFIGGGEGNAAGDFNAVVAGGFENTASAKATAIGGGAFNEVSATRATVGGGVDNTASGEKATVSGGQNNSARATWATIAGGGPTDTSNPSATGNEVVDNYGTIGGGGNNQAGSLDLDPTSAEFTTVGGGVDNKANAERATVGGGDRNTASGKRSTVGGGIGNTASGVKATVGGGAENTASDDQATVGGGSDNTADGFQATVPGGRGNFASGWRSFAAGFNSKAADDHTFVWSDSAQYHDVDGDGLIQGFSSSKDVNGSGVTGDDTFHVSAAGGIRFVTGSSSVTYISGGSTGWSTTSSRAAKTNVEAVDPRRVLAGVEEMEVSTWEYTDDDGESQEVRHIGPMAEDFHEAFDVGATDTGINSINADGVAFAAIQGLSQQLGEKDKRIAELAAQAERKDDRIAGLEAENDQLRDRLTALEDQVAGLARDAGASSAPADE